MQTQTLFIIFALFAQNTFCTRNNLSRQQKLNAGIINLKPIHFASNSERVKETEEALNEGLDNTLSNNDIHVTHAEREFTLKGKSGQHKYNIVLNKEGKECKIEQTISFAITQCKEHHEECKQLVQNCLNELAPQTSNVENNEQEPLRNEEQISEDNKRLDVQSESSEEPVVNYVNLERDEGVETNQNPNEVQTQTDDNEEETEQPKLLGGYNSCTDHDLKRVHAGLMHLQKYAWMNFDHLYLENIALCTQQFFFRQSNYKILMTFDTTKKCQMKLNVEYDGTVESERVTRVNVYQNTGDEAYAIFKRNPSSNEMTVEYPDCANYYATPLYRMTLEKYNNMSQYAARKQQVTERLNKRHNN